MSKSRAKLLMSDMKTVNFLAVYHEFVHCCLYRCSLSSKTYHYFQLDFISYIYWTVHLCDS